MAGQNSWPKWVFIGALIALGVFCFKLGESLFFTGTANREIAADGRGPDLSNLEGSEFTLNARLRFVEGLSVSYRDGRIYLAAGHFLGPRMPISVCSTYPEIEFEFGGADQASSGEPTILILSSVCEPTRSGDKVEEIEVPFEKILNSKPRDGEMQVFGKRTVKVKMLNVADEWPREWALRSMRVYNLTSEIRVHGVEAYRLRGSPFVMKW